MYLQDWLTLKVFFAKDTGINTKLKSGDKVVYLNDGKKFIANYIGYKCNLIDGEVKFLYKLSPNQLHKFYLLDKKAKDIFLNVKDDLKIVFPKLKFITAKMNYYGDLVYLYFYYEDRIDFRPYLGELKKLIGMNFFLYQVGARDRIRLDPASKNICGDCGHRLCCLNSMCKLESINSDIIPLQNLQAQGINEQKGVCGKLKCCLRYEENIYKSEIKHYPKIGSKIEKDGKKYTVIGANIISKYVFMKDEDGFIVKVNLDDLK